MGVFSFVKRLGQKAYGVAKRIGHKIGQAGAYIGKKAKPFLHKIGEVAGDITKYGSIALPAVAGIPIVGEAYAAGLGLAGSVYAGAKGLEKVAGAVSSGGKAIQSGDISGLRKAVGDFKSAKKSIRRK